MKRTNYSGNWFTDMVRDNFWMMLALFYSRPDAPPAEQPVSDDLQYLFGDSEHHHCDILHEDLDNISDDLQNIQDDMYYHHDTHDDFDQLHDDVNQFHDDFDSNCFDDSIDFDS